MTYKNYYIYFLQNYSQISQFRKYFNKENIKTPHLMYCQKKKNIL